MTTSNINLEESLPIARNLTLDWENKDIEQRIGLNGGRFTRANTFFTLVIMILATVSFYGICFIGLEPNNILEDISKKIHISWIYSICNRVSFFWGMGTLFVKWRKLKFQEKALDLAVVPQEPDFSLNNETAKAS